MSSVDHRFARGLGVRSGEGRLAAQVALVFAVIETGRGFGEVGVDALILGRFGRDLLPEVLPYLFMALGGTSLVAALAFGGSLAPAERVEALLEPDVLASALERGRRLSLDEAVELVVEIESGLPPERAGA